MPAGWLSRLHSLTILYRSRQQHLARFPPLDILADTDESIYNHVRAGRQNGRPVEISSHLELLGLTLSSDLNFGRSIEEKAKITARKLGILNKVRRYFTREQILTLYEAQVRPCIEYCSHLWGGAAKCHLDSLETLDRRAWRIVSDDNLTSKKLHSLNHRRQVASLSVFYKIFHGECAQELFDIIPSSPFYHRTTRSRESLHHYVVDIPPCRTKRFASSFLMRTAKLWNSLPATVFPDTYTKGLFKDRVNRYFQGKHGLSSTASALLIR